MKRIAIAAALLLAALPATAFSQSSVAQPKSQEAVTAPAAVEVSRSPFQQYVYSGSSYNLDFNAVPAKSRLEISNVSCFMRYNGVSNVMHIQALQLLVLKATNDIVTASTLAPVPTQPYDANFAQAPMSWSANHAVSVFANANQHFRASVTPSGGVTLSFFACHISGDMVKLQ